jgi:hypothetical protein
LKLDPAWTLEETWDKAKRAWSDRDTLGMTPEEVRRLLARRSQELLARYRRGEPVPEGCPLKKALAGQANLS